MMGLAGKCCEATSGHTQRARSVLGSAPGAHFGRGPRGSMAGRWVAALICAKVRYQAGCGCRLKRPK